MRLFVPGFEGNMNGKWLTSLWVTDKPAHTKDESGEYTEILADGSSVEFTFGMGVKSIITQPSATMSGKGRHFGLLFDGQVQSTRECGNVHFRVIGWRLELQQSGN